MRAETRHVGAYSTVSNLVIGHDLANLLDPWKPGLVVHILTRSEPAHTPIGTPKCKPSAIGLGLAIICQHHCLAGPLTPWQTHVAVRTWPGDNPEPDFFSVLKKLLKTLPGTLKVVDVPRRRVIRPEEIDADSVEAVRLYFLEDVLVLGSAQLGSRRAIWRVRLTNQSSGTGSL